MMKKILMVATVPSMIGQFNMDNINILQEMGYQVHVACDFTDRSVWNNERIIQFERQLENLNVKWHQINFTRSPLNLLKHIQSFRQLKELVVKEGYEIVHCHTPIASAIARVVCRKTNAKCIYTAHGFHFFKGAPLKNWLIYYPIEKFLSKWTDVLITINSEDFERAKSKFSIKDIYRIPGVGIDVNAFRRNMDTRNLYRQKLKVSDEDFVLLSVGELNDNKNHLIILKALTKVKTNNIRYVLCGQGNSLQKLRNVVDINGLSDKVIFAGYCSDVKNYYDAADCFVFPSKREGLGLAAIEAMANGLPIITSNIHGINDYSRPNVTGYSFAPNDVEGFAYGITTCVENLDSVRKMGENNVEIAKKYDVKCTQEIMKYVYGLYSSI